MIRAAQAHAFDCILLGHHHRAARPARHVLGPEAIVVRICTLTDVQPGGAQALEEPPWIADAGDRGDRSTAQFSEVAVIDLVAQCDEAFSDQFHAIAAGPVSAVTDQQIDRREPPLRLAQRPRRQAATIAKSALAIEHQNLEVPPQRIVLQTVITDNDIAITLADEYRSSLAAVGAGSDGAATAARQQHCLVADFRRIAGGGDSARPIPRTSSVSAREDAGSPALFGEPLHEPQDQRRLAGAADRQVAHDDDRYPRVPLQ